jgi:hypothetical protein
MFKTSIVKSIVYAVIRLFLNILILMKPFFNLIKFCLSSNDQYWIYIY